MIDAPARRTSHLPCGYSVAAPDYSTFCASSLSLVTFRRASFSPPMPYASGIPHYYSRSKPRKYPSRPLSLSRVPLPFCPRLVMKCDLRAKEFSTTRGKLETATGPSSRTYHLKKSLSRVEKFRAGLGTEKLGGGRKQFRLEFSGLKHQLTKAQKCSLCPMNKINDGALSHIYIQSVLVLGCKASKIHQNQGQRLFRILSWEYLSVCSSRLDGQYAWKCARGTLL